MKGDSAVHIPRLIAENVERLEQVGIERGRGEIEMMLCHLLDCDRLQLYLHGDALITADIRRRLDEIIEKRATRYPLQFILKESWFYGRCFFVSPAVMIPTPETEVLCETALGFVKKKQLSKPRIIDLGVGSGVISVTMALELPDCDITAVDISGEALNVARRNAEVSQTSDKIRFVQSDYFADIPEDARFDLILANPPYISESEYRDLPPEVLADPKIALTSGDEGLDAIKTILRDAPKHLTKDGRIMFEIGYNQAQRVTELTESDSRYQSIVIIKDLNDIDRVVILSCNA